MEYKVSLFSNPINIAVRFADCCGGIAWRDSRVILSRLSLCCGIQGQANLVLSKEKGFEEFVLYLRDIPLCPSCDSTALRLDFQIKFSTTEKSVSFYPKTKFLSDLCISLYGDIDWEGTSFKGLYLRGFRLNCSLNECQEVELKTAFVPGTLGFPPDEFEYIKIKTCLLTCCEEAGKLEFELYFGTKGQFGLTRIVTSAAVPLAPQITMSGRLELPAKDMPKGKIELNYEF